MAPAKTRSNKRSSGSSYTSTLTTIVFIALCVLGVWMLASNSVTPPQATSRTTATSSSSSSSQNSHQTTEHKSSAVYEDNPGQLPEDAIKPDDNKSKEDQEKQEQQIKDENRETTKQEPEKENENKNEGENVENPQVLHAKEPFEEEDKQKQEGDQISEETSTIAQVHEENRGDTSSRNEQETSGKPEEATQRNVEDHQHQDPQKGEGGEEQKRQNQKKHQRRKKEPSEDDIQEGTSHDQVEHDDQMPHEASTISQFHVETSSETQDKGAQESNSNTNPKQEKEKLTQSNTGNSYLGGANTGIPKESKESKKSWTTQADQSEDQKERRKSGSQGQDGSIYGYTWHLCNVTAGTDYIPCLDNEEAIKKLRSRTHYQHREKHCPEKAPTCLVRIPEGYKKPIEWPHSRDKIWYHNVPHTLLADVKGHQNWVKVAGEFLTFPGGGTQFIHGALHYIDFVQEAVPDIGWGKRTRVILDVGCGVASFGGFLFERDVLAMSFAPKDEHEAQVQFALERGIPAISAVMGTQRLQFPSMVFDLVHCARCRVPWHIDG